MVAYDDAKAREKALGTRSRDCILCHARKKSALGNAGVDNGGTNLVPRCSQSPNPTRWSSILAPEAALLLVSTKKIKGNEDSGNEIVEGLGLLLNRHAQSIRNGAYCEYHSGECLK